MSVCFHPFAPLEHLRHSGHGGGGESVGALGQGSGNQLRRRLGRDVDVVNLASLTLEGDLFSQSLDKFLQGGDFPSELVFDVRVSVSENVDSRFEVQFQLVEILAI